MSCRRGRGKLRESDVKAKGRVFQWDFKKSALKESKIKISESGEITLKGDKQVDL